jgi:hypothetical protein
MNDRSERPQRIANFYCAGAKGPSGHTLNDVLAFTPEQLEDKHDYIQWLFPLKDESKAVPSSPVTNDAEIAMMRAHPDFAERFLAAQRTMLHFYGLRAVSGGEGDVKVVRLSSYEERSANWLYTRPHNFKRLSRILGSLRLFQMHAHADAIRAALEEIYADSADKVSPTIRLELDQAIRFWRTS